jgi:hypothetical protein
MLFAPPLQRSLSLRKVTFLLTGKEGNRGFHGRAESRRHYDLRASVENCWYIIRKIRFDEVLPCFSRMWTGANPEHQFRLASKDCVIFVPTRIFPYRCHVCLSRHKSPVIRFHLKPESISRVSIVRCHNWLGSLRERPQRSPSLMLCSFRILVRST